MGSDADRLSDILAAIARINDRIADGLDAFERDEMLQVWVIHHLQIIGEAARGVSQRIKDRHPEVGWPQIVALRNILVHEYFGLNMHQVWMVAQKELPKLEEQVQRIRADVASDPGCSVCGARAEQLEAAA
jgi:uncharacterized protein with HEPN domain